MASANENKIPPEAIINLKDRLKHGQNVTKILESQLDTAQQNITLLQGQVRLANETISNLKKHFYETENILSQLLTPEQKEKLSVFESESKDSEIEGIQKNGSVDSTTRSPLPSEGAPDKSFDEKTESNKSPYAIQLRQVLDVLDEEPRKNTHHHEVHSNKECSCSDCQTPRKRYDDCDCGSSSCSAEHFHRKNDDYCKSKHKINSHSHREESPKGYGRNESSHVVHSLPYSNHCTGPCCSNPDQSYKVVEKSPSRQIHYVSVHSPGRMSEKHGERHHAHCGDKCQCHSYVNYVPYGYHVVDGVPPGMPESIQPLSPSARRKRPYVPVIPVDEPPHLKYTKVKRIDGSKLTAQKVLQDFTKRRFMPYNPRYDLDLLIVPPPIPAADLIKKNNSQAVKQIHEIHPAVFSPPTTPNTVFNSSSSSSSNNKSPTNCDSESPSRQLNGIDKCQQNNNNLLNNNNNNNNTIFNHNSFKNMKNLPPIKEEREEARSKLESHISKLRNDSYSGHKGSLTPPLHTNNYYEADRNVQNFKQERAISPVSIGSNHAY